MCVSPHECERAFVVSVSVLWCSGRAMQTVECLVTWRLDSTAVLAAFRAGDPVRLENWGSHCDTADTHKTQKGHTFQGLACKTCQYNQCLISLSIQHTSNEWNRSHFLLCVRYWIIGVSFHVVFSWSGPIFCLLF